MPTKLSRVFVVAAFAFLGAPALADERVEFVGFSSTDVSADAGIFGLSRVCAQDFSELYPDARMCLSDEIVRTFPGNTLQRPAEGWTHPILTGASIPAQFAIDAYSGEDSHASGGALSCFSWSSTDRKSGGLVFNTVSTPGGTFDDRSCAEPRRVACCAIVTSPAP